MAEYIEQDGKCWYDGSPCGAATDDWMNCIDCPIARATASNGWGV